MAQHKRLKLFIDQRVQGALVLRAILYWFCCLTTITVMLIVWRIVGAGPARVFYRHFDELWQQYSPPLIASLILLPLVIVDLIRLSNRFVGPIYRLRKVLREMAAGKDVANLSFREGDYWREIAGDLNAIAARLRQQASANPQSHAAAGSVSAAGRTASTAPAPPEHELVEASV